MQIATLADVAAGPDLDALFERLDDFAKNGQQKKAIKTADEILALAPDDEDAAAHKVVANVQLGHYEVALALISRLKQPLAGKLMFEKVRLPCKTCSTAYKDSFTTTLSC